METQSNDEPSARHPVLSRTSAAAGYRARAPRGLTRDLFDRYLDELSSYPLLDAEQELALARTIEEREVDTWAVLIHDPTAFDTLEATLAQHGELPAVWVAHRESTSGTNVASPPILETAAQLRAHDGTRSLRTDCERELLSWYRQRPNGAARALEIERARRTYQAAKDRMVTANLRLVVALAKRYGRRLMPLADLVQEGNLGLLRAVELYDYRRGLRFSTYAMWWIRHAINRALSDRGRLVRVPVQALDDRYRLAQASASLFARLGRQPSVEELASETGLAADRLAPLLDRAVGRDPLWLDSPLRDDSDATWLDLFAAEGEDVGTLIDAAEWEQRVEPLLAELSEMEASIVRMRFGFDDHEELTLREVGDKYGLSRERIRQLQEQALGKLRKTLAPRSGSGVAEGVTSSSCEAKSASSRS